MRFRVSKNVSSARHNFGAAVPAVTAGRECFRASTFVSEAVFCADFWFWVSLVRFQGPLASILRQPNVFHVLGSSLV